MCCSRNQLSSLPPSVCQLPLLRVLIVSNNKLSVIPSSVHTLIHLRQLVRRTDRYTLIFILTASNRHKGFYTEVMMILHNLLKPSPSHKFVDLKKIIPKILMSLSNRKAAVVMSKDGRFICHGFPWDFPMVFLKEGFPIHDFIKIQYEWLIYVE